MDIQPDVGAVAPAPKYAAALAPETEAVIAATVAAVVDKVTTPGVTVTEIGATLVEATKPFWASKTLIAGLVTKASAIVGLVGITVDPHDVVLISIVSGVVTILGSAAQSLFHVISTKKPV